MLNDAFLDRISGELDVILPKEDCLSEADLVAIIQPHIEHLIRNDQQKLINLLYRLDINELKFRQVLDQQKPGEWAFSISELVISREKEKMFWRNKYKYP